MNTVPAMLVIRLTPTHSVCRLVVLIEFPLELEFPTFVRIQKDIGDPIEVRRHLDALFVKDRNMGPKKSPREEAEFQHNVLPSPTLERRSRLVLITIYTKIIAGHDDYRVTHVSILLKLLN